MKILSAKELLLVGLFSLAFASPAAFGKVDPAGNLNVEQSFALIVKVNNQVPSAKVNLTFGIDDKGRKTLTIDVIDAFDPPPVMGGAG